MAFDIGPTLQDATELTVVVDLGGPHEPRVLAPVNESLIGDNSYRRCIARFIDGLHPARARTDTRHGLLDVAFASLQATQDTISQRRKAAYTHSVTIEVPRDACGFFEFWRAEGWVGAADSQAGQSGRKPSRGQHGSVKPVASASTRRPVVTTAATTSPSQAAAASACAPTTTQPPTKAQIA